MQKLISRQRVLFLLLLALCNLSCVNKNRTFSSHQLQKVVDEYLKDNKDILGTIVKVDVDGKQSFNAASGYFDLNQKTPVHPNDKFIIGSITKVFTAVLVLQLVETGKVELQNSIINYLPSDWAVVLADIKNGCEITVEQVLSHRSGLANVTETEEWRQMLTLEPLKEWNPLDILKLTQQKGESEFIPGKGYSYNNTNYLLLGALIENVSLQPFVECLQQNIFTRIGIQNTFLSEGTFGSGEDDILHGYDKIDDNIYDGQNVNAGWAWASGGIISTADDLVRFLDALVSQNLFEKKGTFEQMVRVVGGNEQYGLGLMVFDDPEIGMYYGHGGNFCGTRTLLVYFPKHNTTAVVCHTYGNSYAGSGGENLIKLVMKDIFRDEFEVPDNNKAEIRDILADTSKIHENQDSPKLGYWNFDLQEQWSIDNINGSPIKNSFITKVSANGEIYLHDPMSGKIFVLDPNGNLLTSFGSEEEQTGYVLDMFTISDRIYVFEMGNTCNRMMALDKKGDLINSFKTSLDISPRIFIDREKYIAVRSGVDIDKKQTFEALELLDLNNEKGRVIGKFPEEEKLISSINMESGRIHIMFDDIELFPRLIVHQEKGLLYLGRSDRYLIKKIDLQGNEVFAFTIKERKKKPIPNNFKEEKIAAQGLVGGKEMPDEMRKEILEGIPDQQVYFTHITTDEQGLIYLFVPDIGNIRKQEIDIFSNDGTYLYNGVIELTKGLQKVKPLIMNGEDLFALVKSDNKNLSLIKYRLKLPKLNEEKSK